MAGFTLIALVFAYLFIASKHSETTTNEHESIKTVEPRSAIPENNPSQVASPPNNNLKVSIQSSPVEKMRINDSDTTESDITEPAPGNYIPFYTLKPSREDARSLFIAREQFTEDCMQEKGFDYIPQEYKDEPPVSVSGMGDVANASADGYGIASSTMDYDSANSDTSGKFVQGLMAPVEEKTPNDVHLDSLNPEQQQAWDNALLGSNEINSSTRVSVDSNSGGPVISWDSASCAAIAREKLHGDNVKLAENKFAVRSLQRQVFAAAENDVEYQTSLGQWSNCMSSHGYDFKYPGQASQYLLSKYTSGELQYEELQNQEISIATIDAVCYKQFSVGEVYENALKNAESIIFIENSETIANAELALQRAVNRAQ